MYNKIVSWLDKKIEFKSRRIKRLKKQIQELKEDNLELAMTNDYLLKEVNKYRNRYNKEHKALLEVMNKED